jgi:HEXXH motif-containing protein
MIDFHHVPEDSFAALAAGLGGPDTVTELAAAQRSKRLLLLRYLCEAGVGGPAVEALVEADRRNRDAVADLIRYPLVGAWAAQAVRGLIHDGAGRADNGVSARFATLAAAAALRAGLEAEFETWTVDRTVTLPATGSARFESEGRALVVVSEGGATISHGTATVRADVGDPRWHPLRTLVADHRGIRAALALEDGDPYRDCYHAPPAQRLSAADADRWQDLFGDAWALLTEYVPERAAELSAGMRAVVPLVADDTGMARSGTARDAFGVAGMTPPGSAVEFAVTLVHEFQHSKLSALFDLVRLHVPGGTERHFAPWRVDARPTGGLLQGVYAFLGIAHTWRALSEAPAHREVALLNFATVCRQVRAGLAALEASAELTARGRDFVAGLRDALAPLLAEPVPNRVAQAADAALDHQHLVWATHNSGIVTTTSRRER